MKYWIILPLGICCDTQNELGSFSPRPLPAKPMHVKQLAAVYFLLIEARSRSFVVCNCYCLRKWRQYCFQQVFLPDNRSTHQPLRL